MKRFFIAAALASVMLLTISCNKTINKEYNGETMQQDLKEIVQNEEADTTEAVTIAMYVLRAQMVGEKLEGKTYKEILESAKEIQKKNDTASE